MIRLGPVAELDFHPRYTISLRSKSLGSKYHSIVLYGTEALTATAHQREADIDNVARRLSKLSTRDGRSPTGSNRQWHAMEEECPHLGASMVEAEIDIESDGIIAICPWHKSVSRLVI